MATLSAFLVIAGMEKAKQAEAVALLTKANYVLAVLVLGGLFTAFKLGLLM